MGNLFSVRRWRRTPERQPLLPTVHPRIPLPPPQFRLDKIADVIGAVNAGKLPSHDQLTRILQSLLRFLRDDSEQSNHDGGTGPVRVYKVPLSDRGRKIVEDVREIAEAMLQISMKLNHDDKLQDMIFRAASIRDNPLNIDEVALGIKQGIQQSEKKATPPATEELKTDVENMAESVKTLLRLVVTSAAFRMILSDLLLTIRETLEELAADVGCVALQVQVGAEKVMEATKFDDATFKVLKGTVKEAAVNVQHVAETTADRWVALDPARRARDTVVGRIQEVIRRAHTNPKFRSSLYTMLLILRKYVEKLRSTATAVQANDIDINLVVSIDENANLALSDLKTLLERAASGTSLDPFLHSLAATTMDMVTAPAEAGRDLQAYFSTVGVWLDCALSQTEYVTSVIGIRTAEHLYDSGRSLFSSSSNIQWAQDIRRLTKHFDEFMAALKSDRATLRFLHALDTFSSDFGRFGQDLVTSGLASSKLWREELLKDVIGWLVPKFLITLRAIPMPRVEFKNNMLDVAVDSLWLRAVSESASLVPDNVWMQHWSEVRLDMKDTESNTSGGCTVRSSSRVRIYIDGIRISARDIGYYFKYKGFVGYNDEGLLSINVGGLSAIGQGLSVDIDLGMTTRLRQASSSELFFRVQKVKVNVPGLTFSINRSKHRILNKVVLQPLLGPVVRRILAKELEQRILHGVEAGARMLTEVVAEADERSRVRKEGCSTFEDYWGAFLEKTVSFFSSGTEVLTTLVEAHTTATQLERDKPQSPTLEETVIVVGGGAQLFPNKGGPHNEAKPNPVADMVTGVVDEIVGKTHEVTSAVKSSVVKAREDIARAGVREEESKRAERRRQGWRSPVFDFGGA